MSETPIRRCPTCGSAVTVAGGEDEPGPGGTRYYVPVGDMARLREAVDQLARLAGPGYTTAEALGIVERLRATEGGEGRRLRDEDSGDVCPCPEHSD